MAVHVTIKGTRSRFFIQRVQNAINQRARRNVEEAAKELLDDVVRNITQGQSPPASVPGDYPHRDTGELSQSGRINIDKESDGIFARVSFTADHAPYVEKSRPFLSRTADERREKVQRTLLRRIFDWARNRW